ncbi:MAG: hypothetical protein ACXV2I_09535, partial [Actinomycetes bacterium]
MRGAGLVARPAAALVPVLSALVLVGVYVAAPDAQTRAVVWVLAGTVTAAALCVSSRHERVADPLPTWLLAAGIALLSLGQAVGLTGSPSPSIADLPRLLAYPTIAAAVVAFQRDRIRHDRASLLDALVVTVAAAQAGWLSLLEPVLRDGSSSLAETAVAGAYPLGDLLVLAVVARLGFAVVGSRDGAARLLGLGLGLGVVAEVSAALTDTSSLTVGWLPGFAMLVLAVRHPSMTMPAGISRTVRLVSAWRFVVLLGLACLVSPFLVLTHPVDHEPAVAAVVLGGAVLLFTLAV